MGIGGHKHHFNDAQIEKQMKGIGDTVCVEGEGEKKRWRFSLGFVNEIKRIMCGRSCVWKT